MKISDKHSQTNYKARKAFLELCSPANDVTYLLESERIICIATNVDVRWRNDICVDEFCSRLLENRVLKGVLGTEGEEVKREWRKIYYNYGYRVLATRYGTHSLELESPCGRDLPSSVQTGPGSNLTPVKWVTGLLPSGKATGAWR